MIGIRFLPVLIFDLIMIQDHFVTTLPAREQDDTGYRVPRSNEPLENSKPVDQISAEVADDRNNDGVLCIIEFDSEFKVNAEVGDVSKDSEYVDTTESSADAEVQTTLDPWSVVWYIGSFGGLVTFFLVVSCSEWCCRRGTSRTLSPGRHTEPMMGTCTSATTTAGVSDTPPPPYHLFAPPAYDSIDYSEVADKHHIEKLNVFVISVPNRNP
ncbi:uncharacterized protein LOC107263509 isoform X2 [Cephus cinctus]|uniref:Uncharacterized protein LOC107263509 isoform X2 n=1 Tax=Cephus cinctus TaxID=211228 RepID=A0AAJ7BHK3_CEPCN|nr:uncharacterized protein LOC107263509 isoform X2 [Cephus cinctus]